jgi:hypothetical protein
MIEVKSHAEFISASHIGFEDPETSLSADRQVQGDETMIKV